MTMRSIGDMEIAGKRLIVRADLNVPMRDGNITDTTRIDRFADGMRPLLQRGARLVVLTHIGRPRPGDAPEDFSTRPLLDVLTRALGLKTMAFADACIGADAVRQSQALGPGEAVLCENLRFHAGETANDRAFASSLARLGDIYVNDAFSCSHRGHASMDALARLLPAASGPLLAAEIEALTRVLKTPERPAVAVVGGAKISSKIAVLKNLARKVDTIIIGGAMANTFLAANGAPVGVSLHEPGHIDTARRVVSRAAEAGCEIALPVDAVCAGTLETGVATITVDADKCPTDMMILDAGPRSVACFRDILCGARTLLWNGPLGAFEVSPFDVATTTLARFAAELTARGCIASIAGGGDTIAALNVAGASNAFSHVSTGGGAFLEWLGGKTLPGIAALEEAEHIA